MKAFAAALLVPVLLLAGPAKKKGSDEKEAARVTALAEELVVLSGAEAEGVAGMEDVLRSLPPARREAVKRIIVKGDLEARLAAIYRNMFTPSEMETLIAFYRTPAGQKLRERGRELLPTLHGIGQDFAKEKLALAPGGEPNGKTAEEKTADAKAPDAKASDAKSGDEASKMRQTMAEMRTLAVIAEAWAVDHNAYPKANSVSELATLAEPNYIRAGRTPRHDAWGTPFRYVCDGKTYRIVSAGADKTFEADSTNLSAKAAGETNSLARDLIFSEGRFIQYPKPDVK